MEDTVDTEAVEDTKVTVVAADMMDTVEEEEEASEGEEEAGPEEVR